MSDLNPPPAWIHWPIRVLAVLFVLPFRLLWEALGYVGRFLARYVGRPLAWLWHHAVEVPAAFLWRYLIAIPAAFLWRYLIAIPAVFLWRYLFAIPGAFLWRYVIAIPVAFLWHYLIAIPGAFLWHYLIVVPLVRAWQVTAPLWRALGRGIAAVVLAGWHGAVAAVPVGAAAGRTRRRVVLAALRRPRLPDGRCRRALGRRGTGATGARHGPRRPGLRRPAPLTRPGRRATTM
jgi:hypothetical protein